MKKKLMALALGIVGFCSFAFSQIPVTGVINGITVNGTVLGVTPGSTLTVGTIITATSSAGSGSFMVVTVPSDNPPGNVSAAVNAINNAFNFYSVFGAMADGSLPAPFGSNRGEYSLNFIPPTQQIPFDFGLSAVLGAGAIVAVKQARKRKKELEAVA